MTPLASALPLLLALTVPTLTAPALAETATIEPTPVSGFSVDVGIGAKLRPTYPGSNETKTSRWLILRNFEIGAGGGTPRDGFSLSPTAKLVASRDADDDDRLTGLDEIDRGIELGGKAKYRVGATTAYATLRKGVHGHHGLTGEFGAKYRIDTSDRLTLWAGLEAGYGDGDYNDTYFGVGSAEAARSGFTVHEPEAGIHEVAASLEARYKLGAKTSILGEVRYGKLVGDAADSPIVEDEAQPSLRLGITRTLNFGF